MKAIIFGLFLLATTIYAQENLENGTESETKNTPLTGTGFFIGVDFEKIKADTRYKVDSQNHLNNIENTTDTYNEPAFKLGYQYYFTRVYLKYSNLEEKTNDYTMDSTTYELNVEYIPIFYRGNSYAVRGIFGAALGYMKSDLSNLSARFIEEAKFVGLNDRSDREVLYGAQIGLMLELSMGLSAELGYRYRKGNLLESENSDGKVTFETKRKQLYLGLNYMF